MLARNDELPSHENVDCTENVAIDGEGTRLGCCEDYSVRLSRHYRDTRIKIVCNRKAVGLSLVKVAHQEANHLPFFNAHNGPRIRGSTMAYAVIEA